MAPPLPPAPVGIRLTRANSPTLVVELFHDVCCPFSKKMFETVFGSVIPELERSDGSDRVELLWQSVPQPWHAQSCCMHDAVMAAAIIDRDKAGTFISNVFAKQADFFDDMSKDLSRVEIYARLAAVGGESGYDTSALNRLLSLEEVEGNQGLGDVTQHLKWAVKYHRVRGVHVTPTVFVNGTEAPDVSSGWSADEWLNMLAPMMAVD